MALTRLVSGVCQRHLLSHLGLEGPTGFEVWRPFRNFGLAEQAHSLPRPPDSIRTQATRLFVPPANSIWIQKNFSTLQCCGLFFKKIHFIWNQWKLCKFLWRICIIWKIVNSQKYSDDVKNAAPTEWWNALRSDEYLKKADGSSCVLLG